MTRIRTTKKQVTIISNHTLQRAPLSWEAKGLLAYCLSMPESWDFKPKTIAGNSGCGKNKMYRMFNELIENDYCIRINSKSDTTPNLWGKVEYEIFDDPDVCRKVAEDLRNQGKNIESSLELKKCFRRPHSRDPQNRDTYKETDSSFTKVKEESKKKTSSASASASDMTTFLETKLKEKSPHFRGALPAWAKQFDRMMKQRDLTAEKLKDYLIWALDDPFWCGVINSPSGFDRNFDTIFLQRERTKSLKTPNNKLDENKRLVENVIHRFPRLVREGKIYVGPGYGYIEFHISVNNVRSVSLSDDGFREQILNNLRKMKLDIAGL